MINSKVEGLNRVLEHEREIRGISASGFFKIYSNSQDISFGRLSKTKWIVAYIKPGKHPVEAFYFELTYNPRRDDYLATIDMMLTTQIIYFVKSDNWEKVINGEDIQPVPDTSY